MERCTIVRWGIVVCLLSCCGCGLTRNMNTASWWPGTGSGEKKSSEKDSVASNNPLKRDNRKKDKKDEPDSKKMAAKDKKSTDTAAKQPDASAKQAAAKLPKDEAASKTASHDAETLKLIEEELKNAMPEERDRLYAEWKPLDSAMVKQIIRIRRMVRQFGQNSSGQQMAQTADYAGPLSAGPLSTAPSIDSRIAQLADAGHASGQMPPASGRTAPSPLGISPWGQPGDANISPQYAGQNPNNPAGNGQNAYASFDRGGSLPSAMNGGRGNFASGGQPASDGLGFREDFSPPGAHQSYPTVTPIGVTTAGAGNNVGAASGNTGGLNASPRGFGQPGIPADASQQFSGAVSSNGGPQIIAGASSSGLSPYYPPNQAAPRSPAGNIIPAGAQTTERPQGFGTNPAAPPAGPPAPSAGLSPFGVGRFFNATPGGNVPPSAGGHQSPVSAKWGEDLQRLIANAAADVAQTGPGSSDAERRNYIEKHVYLRMLFLMAGQQVRAMEPIPGIEPAEQEFWQQIFWGTSSYFDAEAIPDPLDRATQTTLQLRGALQRLQEKARLELRNVNFCHKISSFGNYERFQRDEFSPGQPVLVYAEVSNFKSEQSADGPFRTILKSTIEIFNSRGEMIQSMPFPPTEDLCQNQRRDYFHSYEFTVPQRIGIGPHVMKLTVEDQISQKVATYTLNFTVK